MRNKSQHWMRVAREVATQGTCPRLHVGAVVVGRDGGIVSTGYNGAPRAQPHCDDIGCLIEEKTGRCKRTVHAEANALLQAGKNAVGGTLYCTHQPCTECSNLILNSGIARVYFEHPYTSQEPSLMEAIVQAYTTANVQLIQIAEMG